MDDLLAAPAASAGLGEYREAVVPQPSHQIARTDGAEQTSLRGRHGHLRRAVQLHEQDRTVLSVCQRSLRGGAEAPRVDDSLPPLRRRCLLCVQTTSLSGRRLRNRRYTKQANNASGRAEPFASGAWIRRRRRRKLPPAAGDAGHLRVGALAHGLDGLRRGVLDRAHGSRDVPGAAASRALDAPLTAPRRIAFARRGCLPSSSTALSLGLSHLALLLNVGCSTKRVPSEMAGKRLPWLRTG